MLVIQARTVCTSLLFKTKPTFTEACQNSARVSHAFQRFASRAPIASLSHMHWWRHWSSQGWALPRPNTTAARIPVSRPGARRWVYLKKSEYTNVTYTPTHVPTNLPTYLQTNKQTWIQYNTIPHHNTAQYNILHRCMHAYQNIHKLLSITLHYINPYIKNEHTYKHTYTTLHQYIHYIHTSHYIALHFTEVHCIAWHHITSHYITLHHSTYITNNTKQYHAIQYIHTIAIHYSHGHRLRTLYFSKNQNPALRTWSKPNS